MDRAPPRRPAGPRSTIRAAAGTESENLRRAMAASRRTARAWELEHGDITRALKASSEAERLKAQEEDSLNCALALSLQSAAATPSEKQAAWDRVLELSMETARWKREEEALAKALELSVRSAREEERLRGAEAGAQSRCSRWGEAAMRLHPRARSPHWTGLVSGPGIGKGPGALLQSAHMEWTSSGKGTTLDRDSERSRLAVGHDHGDEDRALARALDLSLRSAREEWRLREAGDARRAMAASASARPEEVSRAREQAPTAPTGPIAHTLAEDAEAETASCRTPEPEEDGLRDWWFSDGPAEVLAESTLAPESLSAHEGGWLVLEASEQEEA